MQCVFSVEKSIIAAHDVEKSIIAARDVEKSIIAVHDVEKSIIAAHSVEKSIITAHSVEQQYYCCTGRAQIAQVFTTTEKFTSPDSGLTGTLSMIHTGKERPVNKRLC